MLFLSGTRADFGKIKPLIEVVKELPGFKYQIFVTGMHMMKKYGETHIEISKSGFTNTHHFINQHLGESMDMVLSNTIQGLSRFVHESRPDAIVVHGDRVEALAGAIVGALNNILVLHIEGGERSGTIDELIRHSISKLAHVHLVANKEAKRRLVQMGEESHSVHVIGSPDMDVMKSSDLPSLDGVKEYYQIPFNSYHVVLFHPVTTEQTVFKQHAKNFVAALLESTENFVVIYPNNDEGTEFILDEYAALTTNDRFKVFPSVRFEYFLTLLKNASSIIGNSSAGIREAPYYNIPTVNVGTRQNLRCEASSIVNCSYDKEDIIEAITVAIKGQENSEVFDYFGTGNSAEIFQKLLVEGSLFTTDLQKVFNDY